MKAKIYVYTDPNVPDANANVYGVLGYTRSYLHSKAVAQGKDIIVANDGVDENGTPVVIVDVDGDITERDFDTIVFDCGSGKGTTEYKIVSEEW